MSATPAARLGRIVVAVAAFLAAFGASGVFINDLFSERRDFHVEGIRGVGSTITTFQTDSMVRARIRIIVRSTTPLSAVSADLRNNGIREELDATPIDSARDGNAWKHEYLIQQRLPSTISPDDSSADSLRFFRWSTLARIRFTASAGIGESPSVELWEIHASDRLLFSLATINRRRSRMGALLIFAVAAGVLGAWEALKKSEADKPRPTDLREMLISTVSQSEPGRTDLMQAVLRKWWIDGATQKELYDFLAEHKELKPTERAGFLVTARGQLVAQLELLTSYLRNREQAEKLEGANGGGPGSSGG